MNRIEKFIHNLAPKERWLIQETITRLGHRDLTGLDIKKLKGFSDLFRVRLGRIRIIFQMNAEISPRVLDISNRNDTTYHF